MLTVAVLAPLEATAQGTAERTFRPLTQAMLNNPDPADWLTG